MQRMKEKGYSCASNAANFARHIWDVRDADGSMGATACVIVPSVWDRFQHEPHGWQRLAWWIHEKLPYSHLEFFPKFWAFNIGWHERPQRRIDSYAEPRGCLTKPGDANHSADHYDEWLALFETGNEQQNGASRPRSKSGDEHAE